MANKSSIPKRSPQRANHSLLGHSSKVIKTAVQQLRDKQEETSQDIFFTREASVTFIYHPSVKLFTYVQYFSWR